MRSLIADAYTKDPVIKLWIWTFFSFRYW